MTLGSSGSRLRPADRDGKRILREENGCRAGVSEHPHFQGDQMRARAVVVRDRFAVHRFDED